jgi:hypothetical protein
MCLPIPRPLLGRISAEDFILLSAGPTREHVRPKEAVFKARRVGGSDAWVENVFIDAL